MEGHSTEDPLDMDDVDTNLDESDSEDDSREMDDIDSDADESDCFFFDRRDMNDVDSDEELDSEDDSGEEAQAMPSDKAVYNREAILEKLKDIAWPQNIDWLHKLTIDHDLGEKVDVNDDLSRERAFSTQALVVSRQAFEKLSKRVSFLNPEEYYIEMVKTDAHMQNINRRLLTEKKMIEEAEDRKKARETSKRGKEVQAGKKKERANQKKEPTDSVKKWRKKRQQMGFAKGNDDQLDLNVEAKGNDDRLDLNVEAKGNDDWLDLNVEVEEVFNQQSKGKRPGVSPGDSSGGLAKRGKEGAEEAKHCTDDELRLKL